MINHELLELISALSSKHCENCIAYGFHSVSMKQLIRQPEPGIREKERKKMKIDESCINHNALLQIADITDFLYENTNTNNCADVTNLMMLAEIKGIVDFAKKLKQVLREV